MTRAALAAGFPDSSSYYRQADAALGMTASQFRRGGAATVVTWTTGDCALGRCLVAQSERGVCACCRVITMRHCSTTCAGAFPMPSCVKATLIFVSRWPRFSPTSTTAGGRYRCRWICRAPRFSCRSGRRCGRSRRVRPAVIRQVAEHIGQPRAVRAVAGACAANSLAVIVPCHRVVREDGALSGYRWGTARKAQLLAREAQHEEE